MEMISALSTEDVSYVRRAFVSLDALCQENGRDSVTVRAEAVAGHRPGPCYVLTDGSWFVPEDYFDLEIDEGAFLRRFKDAALDDGWLANDADAAEAWNGFVGGLYGVCLWHATPENIARKNATINEIESLLENPRGDDKHWVTALRKATDRLDAIERPFSPHYDRVRFGRPPSRDRLIRDVRSKFLESQREPDATPHGH